jgi:hypothetical protein
MDFCAFFSSFLTHSNPFVTAPQIPIDYPVDNDLESCQCPFTAPTAPLIAYPYIALSLCRISRGRFFLLTYEYICPIICASVLRAALLIHLLWCEGAGSSTQIRALILGHA